MSARKKSWFNVAKSFVKAVEKEYSKSEARKKQINNTRSDNVSVTFTVSDDDGTQYVNGMPHLPRMPKYEASLKSHLSKLASFYRDHAAKYALKENENPAPKFISELFKQADGHTCPHCGVVHEFRATRARKCPECGKQMIVRQGVFLSEKQVADFEAVMADFYNKVGSVNQLKNSIERIQSDISNYSYGSAYLITAEGYQHCATIYNQSYEGGYTAWDYSWGILNREALEIATLNTSDEVGLLINGYTEVMFSRGMQCLRQLKLAETTKSKQRFASLAISELFDYLIALNITNRTDWHQEEAIKNIHIAKILGGISDTAYNEIKSQATDRAPVKPSGDILSETVSQVEEYIFLENEPERLKQLIY